jgi:hypothetical protein
MGQDFLDMQEAAVSMTKAEFVSEYGKQNADVYEQINRDNLEPDPEIDIEEIVKDINDQIPF